MTSGHCDPPVRMALHTALVETVHMTLQEWTIIIQATYRHMNGTWVHYRQVVEENQYCS